MVHVSKPVLGVREIVVKALSSQWHQVEAGSCGKRKRYIHKGGETFRLMVPLTLVPEIFLEIFIRERESEPRSGEERENPLVTLTSNLIFMQTTGS